MAALEKVRNLGGLTIVVVGVALLAFILGDLFSNGNMFNQQGVEIAEVNGEKISYYEYQDRVESQVNNMKAQLGTASLDDQYYQQIQTQVWDQLINKIILDEQLAELGMQVSQEELFDMVQGGNVHPEVRNIPIFKNSETGEFDPQLVIQFLQNMEMDASGQSREAWLAFEEYLVNQRAQDKYTTAVTRGMHVTDAQAMASYSEKNSKYDLKALFIPYTEIADSTIAATKSELEAYYKERKNTYKQKESVDIEYVVFPIIATGADREAIQAELVDLQEEFAGITEHQQYVNANSDGSFDGKFYRKGEYPNALLDSLMFTMEPGQIYGPYLDGEIYKLSKITKREAQPDSLLVSEILLVPSQQEEIETKRLQADSLADAVNNGAKIATMGSFSADAELLAEKWVMLESLPYADQLLGVEKGKAVAVAGNDGFHVVYVAKRGKEELKAQLATLERKIVPSEETRTDVYMKTTAFASQSPDGASFQKNIQEQNLVKKLASNLEKTASSIRGLGNARSMIREAFSTDENQIVTLKSSNSPIFEIDDNYVVACVTKRRNEGFTPVADLTQKLEDPVRKHKKAVILIDKVNKAMAAGAADLDALAAQVGGSVKDVKGLSFAAFSVPGLGIEPKINGIASVMKKDEISAPIEGNNGVYVLKMVAVSEVTPNETDLATEKTSLERTVKGRVGSEMLRVLKENADVVDNRIRFQ